MATITDLLEKYKDNFDALVGELCTDTRPMRFPREYKDEYDGLRLRRRTSVGWREDKRLEQYSETLTDKAGNPVRLDDKIVHVARITTNFPRKLVRTDSAFLFGGDMRITADNMDEGFIAFKQMWTRVLGMQDVLLEFAEKVMSETHAAIVFYPIERTHWSGRTTTDINCRILSLPQDRSETCEFYPHFHGGAMDAFIHKFDTTDSEGRMIETVLLYTAKEQITAHRNGGAWTVERLPNIWGLIPVVYAEIGEPAWDESASPMDAREMRLSRMSDTNDYFSEPILKVYGEADLPGKKTVGKELQFPFSEVDENGNRSHGDAEFLSWQQSIDSVVKELDTSKSEMFSGASLPDLSFESLKGMGNLSGVSRRFMLLDAEIKALFSRRIFRPALNRCVTIVTAGIANITNIKLKPELVKNWITVEFDSILPKDPVEEAQVLSIAGGNRAFNSMQTIVAQSPLTPEGDIEGEIERVRTEREKEDEQSGFRLGETV